MPAPKPSPEREYSLAELSAISAVLCEGLATPADERVRTAPDERTLRYYQTCGLVDRPLRYDGRNAVYGYRHLLQAVTVKALQGQGLSLAQVQRALLGASTNQLEAAIFGEGHDAAPGVSPLPAGLPAAAPAAMRAFQLAPGVTLTIDPAQVADPEALATALFVLTQSTRSQP